LGRETEERQGAKERKEMRMKIYIWEETEGKRQKGSDRMEETEWKKHRRRNMRERLRLKDGGIKDRWKRQRIRDRAERQQTKNTGGEERQKKRLREEQEEERLRKRQRET
jgi:hypothetical protein